MEAKIDPIRLKGFSREDLTLKIVNPVNGVMSSKKRYVFRHYAVPILKRLLTRYEEEEVTDAVPTKRLNELLDHYVTKYQEAHRKGDEQIVLFLRTVAEEYCDSVETRQYFVTLFIDLVSECFKTFINQWEPKNIRYFNFAVEENNSHAVINIELI